MLRPVSKQPMPSGREQGDPSRLSSALSVGEAENRPLRLPQQRLDDNIALCFEGAFDTSAASGFQSWTKPDLRSLTSVHWTESKFMAFSATSCLLAGLFALSDRSRPKSPSQIPTRPVRRRTLASPFRRPRRTHRYATISLSAFPRGFIPSERRPPFLSPSMWLPCEA